MAAGPALGLCAGVEALVPAHSLGATDPAEAALVNAGLAACPDAADELARYTALAQVLLYSAPPTPAPPHLAEQLQAALRHSTSTAPRRTVWQALQAWPIRLYALPTPLAAAGVILLLLGLNLYAIIQNRHLRAEQTSLIMQQEQQAKALRLLATANPATLALDPVQEDSPAQANVVWDSGLGVAVLHARNFPPLAPEMAYQLWLQRNGERSSAGLFTVDATGSGMLVFPTAHSLASLEAIGITPEPVGGSPAPTGQAVVRRPSNSQFRE